MKKKLMQVAENIDSLQKAVAIKGALELRADFLEDKEPDSDGYAYNVWEEKCDDLQDIIEKLEQLIEYFEDGENDKIPQLAEDVSLDIDVYQSFYGGLARLNIEEG